MIGFLLGCAFGGVVVFVLMCCAQMGGIKEYETLLTIASSDARASYEDAMYWKNKYDDLRIKHYDLSNEYEELKGIYYGKNAKED